MNPFSDSDMKKATIGSLEVEVLRASGACFETSHKHRVRVSVSTQLHHTSFVKCAIVNKKKPVEFTNEKFHFDIGLPTDFLMCTCVNSKDEIVGSLNLALAHLPQNIPIMKWYELKSKSGDSCCVIQLRLNYQLSYSIHRRDDASSLTIVPSQSAKEYIRKQLLAYARTNKTCYRFIDYFLLVGMETAQYAHTHSPSVIERYPLQDHPDFSIPDAIATFCFPSGFHLSSSASAPVCFSFRLNNSNAMDQTTCVCLTYSTKVYYRHKPKTDVPGHDDESSVSSTHASSSSSHSIEKSKVEKSKIERSTIEKSKTVTSQAAIVASPSLSAGIFNSKSCGSPPPIFSSTSISSQSFSSPPSPHPSLSQPPSPLPQEDLSVDDDTEQRDEHAEVMWLPRCWCIVSRLSFVPQYKDILSTLYQHYVLEHSSSDPNSNKSDSSSSCTLCSDLFHNHSICTLAETAMIKQGAITSSSSSSRPATTRALSHPNTHTASIQSISTPSQPLTSSSPLYNTISSPVSLPPLPASSIPRISSPIFNGPADRAASPNSFRPQTPSSKPPTAGKLNIALPLVDTTPNSLNLNVTSPSTTTPLSVQSPSPRFVFDERSSATPGVASTFSAQSSPVAPVTTLNASTPSTTSAASSDVLPAAMSPASPPPSVIFRIESPLGTGVALPTHRRRNSNMIRSNTQGAIQSPSSTHPTVASPLSVSSASSVISPSIATVSSPSINANVSHSIDQFASLHRQSSHDGVYSSGTSSNNISISAINSTNVSFSALPASTASSICSKLPCSCNSIRVCCMGRTFEQYVLLLCDEVPLPVPGGTPVELCVCCKRYRLTLPSSELDLPHLEFSIINHLLHAFDLDNVLLIIRCILTEMKVVFHSSQMGLLHSISECLLALCFPFQWCHVYIPLLPAALYGVLEAPVSFMVGLAATASQVDELLHDADRSQFVVVDIDQGLVHVTVPPPDFPANSKKELINTLRKLAHQPFFEADKLFSELNTLVPTKIQDKYDTPTHDTFEWHSHYCPSFNISSSLNSARNSGNFSALFSAASPTASPTSSSSTPSFTCFDLPSCALSSFTFDFSRAEPTRPIEPPMSARHRRHVSFDFDVEDVLEYNSSVPSPPPTQHQLANIRVMNRDRSFRIEMLRFLADLLANYRDYLFFMNGAVPVFDNSSFLAFKARNEALPFLSKFLDTQMFRNFLDRHVEFPSYLQDYLLYVHVNTDCNPQKAFFIPLPPQLSPSQFYTLLSARLAIYTSTIPSRIKQQQEDYEKLLKNQTSIKESNTLLSPFKHMNLYTCCGWSSQLPTLHLLSPTANTVMLDESIDLPNTLSRSISVPNTLSSNTHTTPSSSTSVSGTPIPSHDGVPPAQPRLRERRSITIPTKAHDDPSSESDATPPSVARSRRSPIILASAAQVNPPVLASSKSLQSSPITPKNSLANNNDPKNKPRLFPRTRRFVIPGAVDMFVSGKNPSSLTHIPISSMYQNMSVADEINKIEVEEKQEMVELQMQERIIQQNDYNNSLSIPRPASAQGGRVPRSPGVHRRATSHFIAPTTRARAQTHSNPSSRENSPSRGEFNLEGLKMSSEDSGEEVEHHRSNSRRDRRFTLQKPIGMSTAAPTASNLSVSIHDHDSSSSASSHQEEKCADTVSPSQSALSSPSNNVLRPRGSLTKSTLSLHISDHQRTLSTIDSAPPSNETSGHTTPSSHGDPTDQQSVAKTFSQRRATLNLSPSNKPSALLHKRTSSLGSRKSLTISPNSLTITTQFKFDTNNGLAAPPAGAAALPAGPASALFDTTPKGTIIPMSARPKLRTSARQMSLNLISKSELEKKKHIQHSRLHQLITRLMSRSLAPIDMAELSAVGELLALPEWRHNLVDLFGIQYQLFQEQENICMISSSFLNLSLLFNIALEECNTDEDYNTALHLLHFAGKIYHVPNSVDVVATDKGGDRDRDHHDSKDQSDNSTSSAAAAAAKAGERVYLVSTLSRQSLWSSEAFWEHAYMVDISAKLEHNDSMLAAYQPHSGHSPSTPRTPHTPHADRDSAIFELCAGMVYLQLSLGVAAESVRTVMQWCCTQFQLPSDKQHILMVLIDNALKTQQKPKA